MSDQPDDGSRRNALLEKLHNDPMQLVEAFFESEKQDRAAEYVSRGRRFSSAGINELTNEITRYFSEFAADPGNPEKFRTYQDACSELRLRGHEPPLPTPEELESILRHARPLARDDRIQEAFSDDIKHLLRTLTNPRRKS